MSHRRYLSAHVRLSSFVQSSFIDTNYSFAPRRKPCGGCQRPRKINRGWFGPDLPTVQPRALHLVLFITSPSNSVFLSVPLLESTSMAVQTAASTSQQAQIEYQMLLNGPAGTPPAGVISNFENPPNLDVYLHLMLSLCMVFASLALFIRMYTKILLLRSVGYEDCRCSYCIS